MKEFKESNGIDALQKRHAAEISEMKNAAIRKQLEIQASFDRKVRDINEENMRDKIQLKNYYN